jgi:hypothetical protein
MQNDKLWWDMIYLDSDIGYEGAREITDEISQILKQAVS